MNDTSMQMSCQGTGHGVDVRKCITIKMAFQGNGFSHQIKNFYEEEAKKQHLARLINYCPMDNFRMVALNESHGYKRTGKAFGVANNIIEWVKVL